MLMSKNKVSFSLKIIFFIRIFAQKGKLQYSGMYSKEDNEKQIPDTLKMYTEICRDQAFCNTGQLAEAQLVC